MLKKIVVMLLVAGYLLSGFYIVLNLYSINENTLNLEKDPSAVRVDYIDANESIYLENGRDVDGDSIKYYVKINKGSGTWYLENDTLAVETSFSDMAKVFLMNIIYVVCLTTIIVRWFVRNNIALWVRRLVLAGYLCESLVVYFIIGIYFERVLDIL